MESKPPRIRDAGAGQVSVCSRGPFPQCPTGTCRRCAPCWQLVPWRKTIELSRLGFFQTPHQIVCSSYHQWRWRGGQVHGGIDRAQESSRYTTVVWETGSLLRVISSQEHLSHRVHLCVSYEKALHPGRWTSLPAPAAPGWGTQLGKQGQG